MIYIVLSILVVVPVIVVLVVACCDRYEELGVWRESDETSGSEELVD